MTDGDSARAIPAIVIQRALWVPALAVLLGASPNASEGPPPLPRAALGPRLTKSPLDPPLTVTGGFGEYRNGHFHAGFDLGTGGRLGKPVRAPETGWVERVRCSGVGYGRSVYLRAMDGRTFQLGHLDAFAKSIDRYVRVAQDSSGQYEQDLWPAAGELPVRAGEVVAWSGQSGAGGPHLHFEIRRGDFAFHPQRAGLVVTDRKPPTIPRVTLEPLDDSSAIAGGMGPVTIPLGRKTTVRAIGRFRVIVDARDGAWKGVDRNVPWAVGMTWRGKSTECRFDSVSWATDMAEGDYVHDAGRVIGEKGIVLWTPAGYRPRFLRSDTPLASEAGTVELRPGDPPESLLLWARDAAGGIVRRTIVLRPGERPGTLKPPWWRGDSTGSDLPGEIVSLPGGNLRWSIPRGLAPAGVDLQVRSSSRRSTRIGERWYATFPRPFDTPRRITRVPFAARLSSVGAQREVGAAVLAAWVRPVDQLEIQDEGMRLSIPSGALFEDGFLFLQRSAREARAPELVPLTPAWNVGPSTLPLRLPVRVTLTLPSGQSFDRVGLCRRSSDGWLWLGADPDNARRTVSSESRALGAFAVFRDATPPRATLLRPPRRSSRGPYSHWSLEAAVEEAGSGIDAHASWLEVDGRRVPTEWDPEAGRLRWRPIGPPSEGIHRVVIVVTDRAGNSARRGDAFRVSG